MSADKQTKSQPVMGYLTQNWHGVNERTPAVIVNPEAQPLDLLVWCWAELQSLQSAVNALQDGSEIEINKGDFSTLIFHRIEPLSEVLETAIDHLFVAQRKAIGGGVA